MNLSRPFALVRKRQPNWRDRTRKNHLSVKGLDSEVKCLDFVPGDFDEDFIEVLAGEALLDLGGRAGGEDLAVMEEEDVVADLLDVAHVVLRV